MFFWYLTKASFKQIHHLPDERLSQKIVPFQRTTFKPSAVHLRKIYIHLRQQLKEYGKHTFISTSMNFINANELSIMLFAYALTFNSIYG